MMGEDQLNFSFVERDKMTSVYEIGNISDLPQEAYRHFMNYEDEVLYILDDGKMAGVISIGDLERFYDKEMRKLEINRKYTFVDTVDFHAAEDFFSRVKSVNEMPVVSEDGELIGCIRKDKEESLRLKQRRSLIYAREGKYRWLRGEFLRFVKGTKARVFFYSYSDQLVDKEEHERLRERKTRKMREDVFVWQLLSDEEWRKFWQLEYEDGIAETMQEEKKRYRPRNVNGVAVFPDGEGKCYRFRDGYRFTPNNPPDADRKIVMFGPCIAVGAFCKDHQTIEAYLQDYLVENGYTDWKVLNRGAYGGVAVLWTNVCPGTV